LIPEKDAPVVARLRKAGAVIMGKTNIPAFSYDGTRANTSWDGPTYNAANRATAPGASSAGTATAVAAAFSVIGLAEETGGSIQNPAAAQGLVSVKPTFALVPNAGVVPIAGSTRDVVGPHARCVADAAILLDVLAGYTPEDPKTVASIGKIPKDGYGAKLSPKALEGKRLGLYGAGWRTEELCKETKELYERACKEVSARGAKLVEDPFAGTSFAALAKVTGGFDARGCESIAFDFEAYLKRLGPKAPQTLEQLNKLAGKNPFAKGEILESLTAMLPVLATSLADPDSIPDLAPFLAIREEYLEVFNSVMDAHNLDGLVFPQTSSCPPGIFSTTPWPATTVSEINIAGIPGVTVPAGKFADGSPFSLLFVGRMWSEGELLAFAFDYEQATKYWKVPELAEEPFKDAPKM
jgi:Asp-tRNA(Asn)/Glu-tRNA(Gln) amidotransferase A subunit family amidase